MTDEEQRAERLKSLVARGHGDCLEAIKLEPNIHVRRHRLQTYVETRSNSIERRQARRLLDALIKETSVL